MTIVVSPHGRFLGYVYVQGNEPTDPGCSLGPGNATIIPYGSCGGINVVSKINHVGFEQKNANKHC